MANTIEVIIGQTGSGSAIADVQKQLGGLGSAASGATGFLGKFAGGLGGIATVAGGMIAADLFGKIVSGVSNFVSTGLEAVGSSQQLETSLKALLTANNMYAQTTETVTSAVTKQLMSQEELGIKHDELAAKLATQQATYQEQQERIRQLTAQYGENGLAVIKAKAQHDQLALAMQDTQREMAGLTTTETTYTTATKMAWEQTMSQADAFKIASTQTQDLLDFVSRLAVVSPFETETVELTTKYAIAAGLGVDATKEFVPAFLDLAGAVGITSSELGFAADQLFQVKKVGKLTEIDLRQLRRVGIDLGKIIGVEMGMSIEEFNAKAAESPEIFDELFGAVANFSKNTFAGTAKEMALSVKGLQSTFSDIFVIGARTFLRPLVDAMTPVIAEIASTLSDFVLGGQMAAIGQQLADTLMGGMAAFQAGGVSGLLEMLGITPAAVELFDKIVTSVTGLATLISSYLGPALDGMASPLSLINTALEFINTHFAEFQGALIGVGAVLAAGVFAAIVAAVIGLLSPINLLIAAAALLGAAWMGNWGNIQGITFAAWAVIQPVLMELWTWLQVNLPVAIQYLSDFWSAILLPALTAVAEFLTGTWFPLQIEWWTWVGTNLPLAIQYLSDIWTTYFLPAITLVWTFITGSLIPLFMALAELINAVVSKAVEALALIFVNYLLPAITSVWSFIMSNLIPIFIKGSDVTRNILAPAVAWATDKFNQLMDVIKRIPDFINEVIEKILELADAVSSIDLGFLQPGSPSPFEMSLMGINRQLGILNQLAGESALIGNRGAGETGGRTYNTNYYFSQTVNSRADSSSVIGDFQVMRMMLGA